MTEASPRQTWIVGSDGSTHAAAAIDWAARVADGRDVVIRIVSAWQYPYVGLMPMAGSSIPAMGPEVQEAILRDVEAAAADAADNTSVPIEAAAALGPAAQVLLDEAESADFCIVGNRGRGGFARLILGSVSHQMATHSPVPVAIVPESATTELRKIVVGFDNSENAMAALRWALEFAPEGAAVMAATAWQPPYLGPDRIDEALFTDVEADASEEFEQAVDRVEAMVGMPGRCTRVFDHGHPDHVLTERSTDADLLVVGARGRGAVGAAILGSVSTRMVHHLPCTTVVVPEPES